MVNKVKRLCVVVGALMFATVSAIAMAQEVITVNPYRSEYVIMVGCGYDLPTDNSSGKLFYIPINPDGTFGNISEVADIGYRSGAGIADFDNDGDLDFVAGAREDDLAVANFYLFENGGNGNFVKHLIAYDVPSNDKIGTFAVADFNKDGLKDFVAPMSGVGNYLFINNGNNTFTWSFLPFMSDALEAKEGDFNEDGYMDFVVTQYSSGYVYLYEGNGVGGFTQRYLFDIGFRAGDITTGDFNSDGHLDFIVDDCYGNGNAYLYTGDGNGNFPYPSSVVYTRPLSGIYYTYGVDSFDFDKDGNRDLILSTYDISPTGVVFIMKGNGNGTFQSPIQIATGLGSVFPVTPAEVPVLIVAIDINPWLPNIIPLKPVWGFIPVAILSTMDFDAPSLLKQDSLTFGGTGDEASLAFCSRYHMDVNRNGYQDLICFFYKRIAGFQCGDTEGILKGKTVDGTPIEGVDSVKIIPCR